MSMGEQEFRGFVRDTLSALFDQIDALETDGVEDISSTDGVVSCTFAGGGTFVLSQQVPARELWLSANLRAWHFRHDAARGGWFERDSGEPMLPLLSRLFAEKLGLPVQLRA